LVNNEQKVEAGKDLSILDQKVKEPIQ